MRPCDCPLKEFLDKDSCNWEEPSICGDWSRWSFQEILQDKRELHKESTLERWEHPTNRILFNTHLPGNYLIKLPPSPPPSFLFLSLYLCLSLCFAKDLSILLFFWFFWFFSIFCFIIFLFLNFKGLIHSVWFVSPWDRC